MIESKTETQEPIERGDGLTLIGYRGTGKSTVGKLLAERVDRLFLDADLEIQIRAGRPIPEIFAAEGEAAFREWERRTLAEITSVQRSSVIASGGGAVLLPENRRMLRKHGLVVWLKADPEVLAQRIFNDQRRGIDRPSLTKAGPIDEIAEVLKIRTPIYRELADMEVDVSAGSPSEIAETILRMHPTWTPVATNAEGESPPCS